MAPEHNIRHIAFIMDGNGRWAKARGLARDAGHKAGSETFRKIVRYCGDIGIGIVTVYAFSTENWKRPEREVNVIMQLLYNYLDNNLKEMMDENISFRVIGDVSRFSPKLQRKIAEVENATSRNERILNVALNYGGRDELVHAFNKLAENGAKNITEEDISRELYTAGCPDPDLIVRTSGELRLSNFLLWQSAYSELYFTDVLWPDMTTDDIDKAVEAYNSRKRRYGGV